MRRGIVDDRGVRGVLPDRTLFDAEFESESLDPVTIEARFIRFHQAHPEVYRELRRMALGLVHRGWTHIGIGSLWETLRYHSMLGSTPDESPVKLNNDFRSRYSRLLQEAEPELAGVFETRRLKTA